MYAYISTVKVIEAKDLVAADRTGTSDPYVVLNIEKQRVHTKMIEKTLNPKWNEEFKIYLPENNKNPLKFSVFDYDVYSNDDSIGDCSIDPKKLQEGFKDWIPLNNVKSGQIYVEVETRPLKEGEEIQVFYAEDENDAELRKARERGETYYPLKGSIYPPSNWKPDEHHDKLPPVDLKLEFAYGYRGYDCRDNIQVNSFGNLIYHGAAIGIVYAPEKRAQKHFFGHNDDIVSLALHPNGEIVATGQVSSLKGSRQPKICIWSAKTLKILAELEGFHQRSVISLGFSSDGNFLVSCGTDDHNSIAVYDWQKKKVVANAYGSSSNVFVTKFLPKSNHEFVSCGVKHIRFWKLENDKLQMKDGVFKNYPIQTFLSVAFVENEIISGSYAGDIYFWNKTELSRVIQAAHQGPVYGLTSNSSGLLISGGKDGMIKVWSSGSSSPQQELDLKQDPNAHVWQDEDQPNIIIRTVVWNPISNVVHVGTKEGDIYTVHLEEKKVEPIMHGHFDEFWGLACHPTSSVFASTGNDKTLRLWNVEAHRMEKALDLEAEGISACFSPNGKYLAVGLSNGTILILDYESFQVVHTIKEQDVRVDDVKFSPDSTLLAGGFHNGLIHIFHEDQRFKKIGTCKGHSSFITHLDWSSDGKLLQSDSGCYEHLFWDMEDIALITKSTLVRNVSWNTWTCVLGWHVKGIWPKGSDGTDINAVCRSFDGNILATSDDFGMVNLFRFPCDNHSKHREFEGHSAHVTNVRFTAHDSHLISAGGNDRFLFQWKCVPSTDVDPASVSKQTIEPSPSKAVGGSSKQVTSTAKQSIASPGKATTPSKATSNKTPSAPSSSSKPQRTGSSLKSTTPLKSSNSTDNIHPASSTGIPSSPKSASSPPSSTSHWVQINVDGKLFQTTLDTLTKDENSKLASMFQNPQNLERDSHGHYLLDVDPTHFAPILNFLRYGKLVIDPSTSKEGVLACAQYLNISEVVQVLSS